MNRPLTVFLLVVSGFVASAFAQHLPNNRPIPRTPTLPALASDSFPFALPESVGLDPAILQGLADNVASWVEAGDLVGAELLIVQDGRTVLHESCGYSEIDPPAPMSREQVISIKSMTKPVTATAVLLLMQDGALSLDDPVSKYIPELVESEGITVHHLLAQTSGDAGGHGGGGYNVYDFATLEDWVIDWATKPREGPPIGQFSYSNFNYAALGLIIERVSGMPCEEFIQTRILDPLGMTESYFAFTPESAWASRVPGRFRQSPGGGFERYWSNAEEQKWKFFPAGFGIWCTTHDYAKFLHSWLADDPTRPALLAPETIREALRPHGMVDGDPVYGYGWFIELDAASGEPVLFRHGGHDGSVGMAFPKSNSMVLFMTHTEAGRHRQALLNQLTMSGMFDHPGPHMAWTENHPLEQVILTAEQKRAFTGMYRSSGAHEGPTFVAAVNESPSGLRIQMRADGEAPDWWYDLAPIGDGRFHLGRYEDGTLVGVDRQAELHFIPASDGSHRIMVYDEGRLIDEMIETER